MARPAPEFPLYGLNDGLNILTLQELLTSAGFMDRQDGSYLQKTEDAVRRYQQGHHLSPAGVANDETWASLTSRTIKKNEPDGHIVAAAQVALFKHHFLKDFKKDVDGNFGTTTEGAVTDFQGAVQLPQTGEVDPKTWRFLIGWSPG